MKFEVSLKYKSGGREVPKDEWLKSLASNAQKMGLVAGASALASKVYCDEHKCIQEVVEDGDNVSIKCCCLSAKKRLQAMQAE